jgi:hypothetical protein
MMPKFQPRTIKQNNAIFGLAAKHGIDHESLRDIAAEISEGRVDRMGQISFDEANKIIHRLGGEPFRTGPARRTVNYQRQQAGVAQIAQPIHLEKMSNLARARCMTLEGLERLGRRMIKHWPPRTTSETNKIIEAIKAMDARDAQKQEVAA